MGVLLIIIGLLIVTIVPFVVLTILKKVKTESEPTKIKKNKIILFCLMPVPLIGFACLIKGITYFAH